ncbi:MAG: RHS repeat-associated core domain-containing protein, partial [Kiritimatiellae bacterium]|nr:RHS repeat-associated core domain-containing protein [Kiritimatiellia bacterium]
SGEDFSFGFSTKYHDREVGLIAYQLRSYSPRLGRWLNRDPIEEEGGVNIFVFCRNNPLITYDKNGEAYFAYRPLDSFLFRHFVIGNRQDDIDNTVIAHEQLFLRIKVFLLILATLTMTRYEVTLPQSLIDLPIVQDGMIVSCAKRLGW